MITAGWGEDCGGAGAAKITAKISNPQIRPQKNARRNDSSSHTFNAITKISDARPIRPCQVHHAEWRSKYTRNADHTAILASTNAESANLATSMIVSRAPTLAPGFQLKEPSTGQTHRR